MGLNGPPGRQVYITSRAFSSRHLRRKSSLAASCPPCHCMPSLSSLAACVCLLIMISSSAFPCPLLCRPCPRLACTTIPASAPLDPAR